MVWINYSIWPIEKNCYIGAMPFIVRASYSSHILAQSHFTTPKLA